MCEGPTTTVRDQLARGCERSEKEHHTDSSSPDSPPLPRLLPDRRLRIRNNEGGNRERQDYADAISKERGRFEGGHRVSRLQRGG